MLFEDMEDKKFCELCGEELDEYWDNIELGICSSCEDREEDDV